MSHYETLDVAKSAGPADIKKAYRKKASAAHPDKNGGDTKQMQAVNQAYDVLSDPERRARYDETGQDQEGPTLEERAQSVLVQFFEVALSKDGNVIAITTKALNDARATGAEELKTTKAKVERLTTRRDKIAVKSGENLVHALIDRQVDKGNRTIKAIEEALEAAGRALELLALYTSTEEGPTVRRDPLSEELRRMMESMDPFSRGGSPWATRRPGGSHGA